MNENNIVYKNCTQIMDMIKLLQRIDIIYKIH